MNYFTYSSPTTCATCNRTIELDAEEGRWYDDTDVASCTVTPKWNDTRLVGWEFTPHTPVIVEIK